MAEWGVCRPGDWQSHLGLQIFNEANLLACLPIQCSKCASMPFSGDCLPLKAITVY